MSFEFWISIGHARDKTRNRTPPRCLVSEHQRRFARSGEHVKKVRPQTTSPTLLALQRRPPGSWRRDQVTPQKTCSGSPLSQLSIVDPEMGMVHFPRYQQLGAKRSRQNSRWTRYRCGHRFHTRSRNRCTGNQTMPEHKGPLWTSNGQRTIPKFGG